MGRMKDLSMERQQYEDAYPAFKNMPLYLSFCYANKLNPSQVETTVVEPQQAVEYVEWCKRHLANGDEAWIRAYAIRKAVEEARKE